MNSKHALSGSYIHSFCAQRHDLAGPRLPAVSRQFGEPDGLAIDVREHTRPGIECAKLVEDGLGAGLPVDQPLLLLDLGSMGRSTVILPGFAALATFQRVDHLA